MSAQNLPAAGSQAKALDSKFFPLSEIRTGMKGYGLTVVSGEVIERFDVEVIGVVPNVSPGRAGILVKVGGLGLEESGIVAGMSGSPVYLEGRLAGAVAAGWAFAKRPIGVVTPIESMLTIDPADTGRERVKRPIGSEPLPASFDFAGRAATFLAAITGDDDERLERLQKAFTRFLPTHLLSAGTPSLLSPVSAGFPGETLGRFAGELARFGFVDTGLSAMGGTASGAGLSRESAEPLQDGSSITALLVDGDLQLGVTGTVTHVLKDGRFVAFGHPFLGLGELELPVANAHIVLVLPNQYQSFKIGYPLKSAFRLTKDRDTGVAGRTDRTAPMVPVHFRFESESGAVTTLNWSVAPHPKLLPALIAISSDAALTTADPTPRERTLRFRVGLETTAGPITYEDEASGTKARDIAILTTSTLAGIVTENDFEEPKVSGVDLYFRSEGGERRLRLLDAGLVSRRVAPGETLTATLRLSDRRGGETTRTVRLRVPKDAPEGKAMLLLSDGSNASSMRFAVSPGEPRTLAEFAKWISRLVPSNKLSAAILVPSRAFVTGSETLTSLPPTQAALLAGNPEPGEPGHAEVGARLLAEELIPFDRPLTGSIRLEFEVERPRS